MSAQKMHLGLLLTPNGAHWGGWRLPEATPARAFELGHYVAIAQIAERGLLDFMFIADSLAMLPPKNPATHGRVPLIAHLEPFTLLAALAAVTRHIGLAASATTTYNHPYLVARVVASLDHLSGGRAGWNLITSSNPAESFNFGFDAHPDKADRYARAAEFAQVVTGLWDSWGDGAFAADKDSGRYFDPARIHTLNHDGERFKVRGPLNLPRSPQGRPIVTQAGSSGPGRALAAATADLVFTAQQTLAGAREFYQDVKAQARAVGRDPAQIVILPGVVPIVGRTEAEARAKLARLQDAFDPIIGLDALSVEFGIDMSVYPLDETLPRDLPTSPASSSRRDLMTATAVREKLTLRQLAATTASLGHWTLCGTPGSIADTLQSWQEGGAADGFMIMPASLPHGLSDFTDLVVPEMQHRRLFRTSYESDTLRGNLGLAMPHVVAAPSTPY